MTFIENFKTSLLKSFVQGLSKRRLPVLDGILKVDGLEGKVEILRDKWGVPHIYADSQHDVLFAQGYVHAQDRFWQMEINRRISRGKMSEFAGKDALSTDIACRIMGYERIAKKDFDFFSEDEKDILRAYCKGINAYINDKNVRFPVELKLARIKPKDWEVLDSTAFSRMLTSLMSWGWYDEILRAQLIEKVGAEAALELDNTYPKGHPVKLPAGIEFNKIDINGKLSALQGPYLPKISGSNAWCVAGSHTDTGKPYLCNDPHLHISNPGIWYENHLVCPDFEVRGVTVPGVPLVQIGHNKNIGWGITLSFTDLEDVFIEKFVDKSCRQYEYKEEVLDAVVHKEEIKIKGAATHIEEVVETIHGTVISDVIDHPDQKLTLCSMAFKPGRPIYGWYQLNKAKNWNDFVEGVKSMTAPGLNITYADVMGNIGYYNSGKMPIKTRTSSALPMPGWDGKSDWKDYVPFEEMPHVFNPKKGHVVTCNNKIEPEDFPHFMGDIYMNGYRAVRLENMIKTKENLGVKDFISMQMDFHCTPAQEYINHFKIIRFEDDKLNGLVSMLCNWDGLLNKKSVEGALYKVSKYFIVKTIYESSIDDKKLINGFLGEGFHPVFGPTNTFLGHNTNTLLKLLKNENSSWIKNAGGKQKILQDGFSKAVNWLKENYGSNQKNWAWGNIHQIVMNHALSVKPPLGKVFNLGPYPIGGDTDTPCQMCATTPGEFGGDIAAASYRQIIDFSNFDSSLSVLPSGQSGNLMSPYYKNQVNDWLEGKFHPMCWSKAQVDKYKKHTLVLKPKTN